jgi:hypothetical protein
LENNFWTEMCPVEFIESSYLLCHCVSRGHRGCDRIVVGFTTTYAISAYHHWCCEFESRSGRGVLDTTLCDKVCQWLATCRWFSLYPPVSSTNETDRHDITEILLKVALNTIKQTNIVCQCPLNYQWFLSVIDK